MELKKIIYLLQNNLAIKIILEIKNNYLLY